MVKENDNPAAAPPMFSGWRHRARGTRYVALGVGTCSTSGPRDGAERSVFYVDLDSGHAWYREVGEFTDGRFEPIALASYDVHAALARAAGRAGPVAPVESAATGRGVREEIVIDETGWPWWRRAASRAWQFLRHPLRATWYISGPRDAGDEEGE